MRESRGRSTFSLSCLSFSFSCSLVSSPPLAAHIDARASFPCALSYKIKSC